MSPLTIKPLRLQPREASAPQLVNVLTSPKRVRVVVGGVTVADSRRVLVLRGNHVLPVYFFPRQDIRPDALLASDGRSTDPLGGEAVHFTVVGGRERREDAAWTFPEPQDATLAPLHDHVAFRWAAIDHWYEEAEEVFVHARDPYARIDTPQSDSRVEVIFEGSTIAESTRAVLLFETHLPTRYYVPQADVRMDRLVPSTSTSRCPYKGIASYWSAHRQDGTLVPDIAWEYRDPIPEIPKIKNLIAFYPDAVDAIRLDGQPVT